MSEPLKNDYTFLKGAVSQSDFVVVSAVVDDLRERSPAQLYGWLGDDWYDFGTYGWRTCGVCILEESGTIVGVSDAGDVAIAARGGVREVETVGYGDQIPLHLGKLRAVKAIGGVAIVTGMGRQVYMRESSGRWKAIDEGVRRLNPGRKPVGFEGIDGFSLENIYGVGWNGEIWHYDSKRWTQKSSPTNQVLTNVCCGGDGNIYVCGRRGLLIAGRDEQWEIVDQQNTIEDFWGIAWFADKLHLATMRAVYVLEGNQLSLVDFGDDIPLTCYDLSVGKDVLCSIGEKDVMLFVEGSWRRLD